jgi:xanthine/uracil permease
MSLLTGLLTRFRDYPYRKHLIAVGLFLIVCLLLRTPIITHEPDTWISTGTIVLVLLCSPKRRPFWFFAGILLGQIIGIIMMGFLSTSGAR